MAGRELSLYYAPMTEQMAQFRIHFRKEILPKWYSGRVHIWALATLIPAAFVYSLTLISEFTWLGVLTFFLTAFGIHFMLYALHRWLLHKRVSWAEWAYKVHMTHHRLYDDKHMTYEHIDDLYMLLLPPWTAFSYYLTSLPLFLLPLYFLLPENLFYYALSAGIIFYGVHEASHYMSHLDGNRPIFRIKLFAWIRNHHLPHHNPRTMNKGHFDITYPCYDFVFGTDYKSLGHDQTTETVGS